MPRTPKEKKTTRRKPRESFNDRLSKMRRSANILAEKHGMSAGYRSGLEFKTAKLMMESGVDFEFESEPIVWTPLPLPHKYHPDFRLVKSRDKDGGPIYHKTKEGKLLLIETKGRFMPDDMAKQLAVKMQHPEIDLRFVFTASSKWYRKAKRMSYAVWCEKHGFKYCDFKDLAEVLPKWLKE